MLIGLSEGNISQLKEGKPAITQIPGTDTEIAIMYGKTEGDIYKELKRGGIKMPEVPEIRKGRGAEYD